MSAIIDQAGTDADPTAALELELAILMRRLELAARRSDLYRDLDRASYLILRTLDPDGSMSINALAAALHLDATTVTRQVGAMVACGLIERQPDPSDRRRRIVRPTQLGLARMRELRDLRYARLEEALRGWPDGELAVVARVLGRLNQALATIATRE